MLTQLTQEFGKRLRYWRNKRGLSQDELEIASGVSQQTISYCELGTRRTSLRTAERLLDALNVSISDFFEEEINNG